MNDDLDPGSLALSVAAPDMLAALLAFECATQLNNVCNDDPSASLEWMDASDDAVSRCAAVLKRLRDAGLSQRRRGGGGNDTKEKAAREHRTHVVDAKPEYVLDTSVAAVRRTRY